MTPEVLAALGRVVAELGADAAVLLRLTGSGTCVVVSSTLGPALGVDDLWGSAGLLGDPDLRPELVTDMDRLAQLVPAGVLRALAVEPTATLVAPVEGGALRIVLHWRATPPPADVISTMESEAMRRFTALAPLLDAQVRAHESATRLRAVVSALDQAVVVTVAGDIVANINAAAARLLGLPAGHVDGTTLATAMRALRERAVDPDALGVEVSRLRESPTAVAHDWVWHLRGSPSHLRVTSVPVDTTAEQGRVWVFDDISAEMEHLESEQRANRALAETEERYRLLAENVSDVVMLGEADGTLTWVSPSVTSALGWSPEDLVGHRASDFMQAESISELNAMQELVMRGETAEFEAQMRTAAGEDRWMEVRAKPVLDDSGRVVGRVVGLWDAQAEHDVKEELERQEQRAIQARSESEERYRLLAENISDVAVLFDLHGVATWVSPSITAVLGWAPEDLVDRTTRRLVNPDHWELAAAAREPLLRGERVDYEVQMRTASGDYRWMEIRVTPLRDDDGHPAGLLAAWWDNQATHDAKEELERSERRSAQALAESEEHYRLLAENVSDVVIMGTPDGTLAWVSPSVTATLGWAPEDLVGHSVPEFVHPDHLEILQSAIERVEGGEDAKFEAPIRTAGGGYRWMDMRGRLLFDDRGSLVGRVAALWDVHESHEAKEKLARSERRYALLLENTTEVVFQTVDEVVTWVSPAAEGVTGWKPADIVGTSSRQLWHPDDWERASWAHEVAIDGTRTRDVLRLVTPDGEHRWMEVVIRPYVEEDGRPGTVGMVYDVSDRETQCRPPGCPRSGTGWWPSTPVTSCAATEPTAPSSGSSARPRSSWDAGRRRWSGPTCWGTSWSRTGVTGPTSARAWAAVRRCSCWPGCATPKGSCAGSRCGPRPSSDRTGRWSRSSARCATPGRGRVPEGARRLGAAGARARRRLRVGARRGHPHEHREDGVPVADEPRAAHAVQRRARLRPAARPRPADRGAGRGRAPHPHRRPAPARPDQRDRRHLADRGRPLSLSMETVGSTGCWRRRSSWCGRWRSSTTCSLRRPAPTRRWPTCTPTGNAPHRCC